MARFVTITFECDQPKCAGDGSSKPSRAEKRVEISRDGLIPRDCPRGWIIEEARGYGHSDGLELTCPVSIESWRK